MSRTRTLRITLVALVATAFVTLGFGNPAQALPPPSVLQGSVTASDTDISASYFLEDCSFQPWGNPLQAAFYTMTVSATGSYDFTSSMTPSGRVFYGAFDPTYSEANCVQTARNTMTTNLAAGTTYTFVVWLCPDGDCVDDFNGNFTINAFGPGTVTWTGGRVTAPEAPPIPPWVQSYGRGTPSEACRDGWYPSWELWMNNGNGGWVCTREIPSLGE